MKNKTKPEKKESARIPLQTIYEKLNGYYGPLNWWPGNSPFEVVTGAILTQNTNWENVSKAISNLKTAGLLAPEALYKTDENVIAELIKPSGYYNLKTKRLKNFLHFLFDDFRGDLRKMFAVETGLLRKKLLGVNGIGEETADSILLYAGKKPVFVIDAYTRRILERHGIVNKNSSYLDLQELFMKNIPCDSDLYNQYHALLVQTGKDFCRKKASCRVCPLCEFANA